MCADVNVCICVVSVTVLDEMQST